MKNYIIATIAAILIATVNTTAKPSTPPVVLTAEGKAYEVSAVNGKLIIQNNTDDMLDMSITGKNGQELYRTAVKGNNKNTRILNLPEGKYNINLNGKAGQEQMKLQIL